jgi:hypothetical protein
MYLTGGFTQGITSAAEFYSAMPVVPIGTDRAARVGNEIEPVSLRVKGIINIDTLFANSRDITVHLFCLESKSIRNFDQVGDVDSNFLISSIDGGISNIQFDGSVSQSLNMVDTRGYKVHKHLKVRLGKGLGTTNPPSLATQGVVTPYKAHHYFDFKIKVPKKLKYQGTYQYPDLFAPFLCMGWVYNDDAAVSSEELVFAEVQSQLVFKNA